MLKTKNGVILFFLFFFITLSEMEKEGETVG